MNLARAVKWCFSKIFCFEKAASKNELVCKRRASNSEKRERGASRAKQL